MLELKLKRIASIMEISNSNRFSGLRGSLMAIFLLLGTACSSQPALPDYRYRLTVEVDTPEGLKFGSSVIEVRTEVAPKIFPDMNTLAIDVTGEAVTVDLGKRGLLFALLRSADSENWAGGAMNRVTPPPPSTPGKDDYVAWHERIVANQGLHVLPRNAPETHSQGGPPAKPSDPPRDYPMFVRFKDIRDPMSVESVDPDNLADSFGVGTKLRHITIQLTKDPVTTGIESRLEWLKSSYDGGLSKEKGVSVNRTLAQKLGFLDFRRE